MDGFPLSEDRFGDTSLAPAVVVVVVFDVGSILSFLGGTAVVIRTVILG